LEAGLQQVIREREHAAARVVNQHELLRVQQMVGDDQVANRVLVDDAAGVANDVRVAGLKAKQILDVDAGIHAGHHGKPLGGLYLLLAGMPGFVQCLALGIQLVILQVLIDDTCHDALPRKGLSRKSLRRGVSRCQTKSAEAYSRARRRKRARRSSGGIGWLSVYMYV